MKKVFYGSVLAAFFLSAPFSVSAQTISSTNLKISYSIFSQVLAPSTKAAQVSGQDPQMLQGQDPQMLQGQDPQMRPVSSGGIYVEQDPQMINYK